MAADQYFRIDLTSFGYDVQYEFMEQLCDSTGCNDFLKVRAVFGSDGIAHVNEYDNLTGSGFQPTPPTQPSQVPYQATETSLRLTDPSGQPNFGDLVCQETL